jgi:hypothetical protein
MLREVFCVFRASYTQTHQDYRGSYAARNRFTLGVIQTLTQALFHVQLWVSALQALPRWAVSQCCEEE